MALTTNNLPRFKGITDGKNYMQDSGLSDDGSTLTSARSFDTGGNTIFVKDMDDIQTYINAASAGDILIIPAGEYFVGSSIVIDKSLTIRGLGYNNSRLTIKWTTGPEDIPLFSIETADRVYIMDMELYLGRSGGIAIKSNWDSTQENPYASGVYHANDVVIKDVHIIAYPATGDNFNTGLKAIEFTNTNGWILNTIIELVNLKSTNDADFYGIHFINDLKTATWNGWPTIVNTFVSVNSVTGTGDVHACALTQSGSQIDTMTVQSLRNNFGASSTSGSAFAWTCNGSNTASYLLQGSKFTGGSGNYDVQELNSGAISMEAGCTLGYNNTLGTFSILSSLWEPATIETAALIAPTLSGTTTLNLNPAAPGDMYVFGTDDSIADGDSGKNFRVYRRAPEGDSYFNVYGQDDLAMNCLMYRGDTGLAYNILGNFSFSGTDDGDTYHEYGRIQGYITDPGDAQEAGAIAIKLTQNGCGAGSLVSYLTCFAYSTGIDAGKVAVNLGEVDVDFSVSTTNTTDFLLVDSGDETLKLSSSSTTKSMFIVDCDATSGTTLIPAMRIDSENPDSAALVINSKVDGGGTDNFYDDYAVAVSCEGTGGGLNLYRDVASPVTPMVKIVDANAASTQPVLHVSNSSTLGTSQMPVVRIESSLTDTAALYVSGAVDGTGDIGSIDGFVISSLSTGIGGCLALYRDVDAATGSMLSIVDNHSGSTATGIAITTNGSGPALMINSGALVMIPDEITATSDGVAADVNTSCTEITTNGDQDLDNVTLGNGYSGQIKHFVWVAAGHSGDTLKITPATTCGSWTQITFGAGEAGDGCTMIYSDSEGWSVIGHNGGVIA